MMMMVMMMVMVASDNDRGPPARMAMMMVVMVMMGLCQLHIGLGSRGALVYYLEQRDGVRNWLQQVGIRVRF